MKDFNFPHVAPSRDTQQRERLFISRLRPMSGNIFELRVALADAIVEYQGGRKVFELCEGNVGLFGLWERLNQLQGVARCYEGEEV